MQHRRYFLVESLVEAGHILESHGGQGRVVAGGTDLLLQLERGRVTDAVDVLVDVSRVPELRGIDLHDGALSIGAAATLSEVAASELVRRHAPGLAQAAAAAASPQIRNVATVGGNLANASPAADTVPALMAAGASLHTAGPAGSREVPVASLAAGPGRTCLEPAELITRLQIPVLKPGEGQAFAKLGRRQALSVSIVNAAACVACDGDIVTKATLAVGAVAPVVLISQAAAALLDGAAPTEALWAQVEEAVSREVRPIDDTRGSAAYRRSMAGVIGRRVLEAAYAAALATAAREGR